MHIIETTDTFKLFFQVFSSRDAQETPLPPDLSPRSFLDFPLPPPPPSSQWSVAPVPASAVWFRTCSRRVPDAIAVRIASNRPQSTGSSGGRNCIFWYVPHLSMHIIETTDIFILFFRLSAHVTLRKRHYRPTFHPTPLSVISAAILASASLSVLSTRPSALVPTPLARLFPTWRSNSFASGHPASPAH